MWENKHETKMLPGARKITNKASIFPLRNIQNQGSKFYKHDKDVLY